jgi:hypothetical protein
VSKSKRKRQNDSAEVAGDSKEDSKTAFQPRPLLNLPDIDTPTTLNNQGSETNFQFDPFSIFGTNQSYYSQLRPGHPDRIAYLNRLAEENLALIRLSNARIAAIETRMKELNSAALALVRNSPIYALRGNNMIPNNNRGRQVSQNTNQSFVTAQEGHSTNDRPS